MPATATETDAEFYARIAKIEDPEGLFTGAHMWASMEPPAEPKVFPVMGRGRR